MALVSVRSASSPAACSSGIACCEKSAAPCYSSLNSLSFKWSDFPSAASLECSTSSSTCRSRRSSIRALYGRGSMSWKRSYAYGNSTESLAVRSVPVQVAHDLLKAGHHYLDVRTPEEFYAGHVEGAVNIPFMYKAGPGLNKNLNFVAEVTARFNKDDEIVVGCQSGKRSMMAANELLASGFTGVTDMGGGYGAWVQSNLPVSK